MTRLVSTCGYISVLYVTTLQYSIYSIVLYFSFCELRQHIKHLVVPPVISCTVMAQW